MYGEDQVPMSVQMPDSVIAEPTGDSLDETNKEANASCGESRRLKRAREDDQVEVSPENDG